MSVWEEAATFCCCVLLEELAAVRFALEQDPLNNLRKYANFASSIFELNMRRFMLKLVQNGTWIKSGDDFAFETLEKNKSGVALFGIGTFASQVYVYFSMLNEHSIFGDSLKR